MTRVARPGRPKQAPKAPVVSASLMMRDAEFSVSRCVSALRAAETLSTVAGERGKWEERIRYWQAQLEFARKRENV